MIEALPPEPDLRLHAQPAKELFVEHYGRLLRFAYLVAGTRADAEDLVHETYLRIMGRTDLHARGFVPYARTIIVNLHRSLLRRARRQLRFPDVRQMADGFEDEAAGAVDLRADIKALPAKQRLALVLRYYEGLDDGEIGTLMRTSSESASRQIRRALASLRKAAEGRIDVPQREASGRDAATNGR